MAFKSCCSPQTLTIKRRPLTGTFLLIFILLWCDESFAQQGCGAERYAQANAEAGLPAAGERRVVFMGNSITEGWAQADSTFFTGRPWINRGISGQTTLQMLARFRSDVISLHPHTVVILAGTNDIAGNFGPVSNQEIMNNIISMCELARYHRIHVILCSVLPVLRYPWRPEAEAPPRIADLNRQMAAYAQAENLGWVDYYSAMADEDRGLKKEFTYDGVHPNLAGYRVMEPLVEMAIQATLQK